MAWLRCPSVLALGSLLLAATAVDAARLMPDGYNRPVASNGGWKLYKFDVLNTNLVYTFNSTSPAPPNAGAYQTLLGELFNSQNQLIGINQWIRTVVGIDPMLPGNPVRSINQVVYEFGTAADGHFDDTLMATVTSKRLATGGAEFVDYDAAITGGTGKFLGATGRVVVKSAALQNNLIVTSGMVTIEAWVPKNLPMPRKTTRT